MLSSYCNKTKENQFNKKGIFTEEDLLNFLPFRYNSYQKVDFINEMEDGQSYCVKGTIRKTVSSGKTYKAFFRDRHNTVISITWFAYTSEYSNVPGNYTPCILCGTAKKNTYISKHTGAEMHSFDIQNPVIAYDETDSVVSGITPVYSKIQGMSDIYLKNTIAVVLKNFDYSQDYDPHKEALAKKMKLFSKKQMYQEFHNPSSEKHLLMADLRHRFDIMYDFYKRTSTTVGRNQFICSSSDMTERVITQLPYPLTESQKKAYRSIRNSFFSEKQMYSLVFGDVGSGKSTVELLAASLMSENGIQSAILNPTQILAKQTYEFFVENLKPLGVQVEYIDSTASLKSMNDIKRRLKSGEIDILVGTLSVISEKLEYKNLGLIVIDEEHRFGVKAKESIQERINGINTISMSATPIPRSLAKTIYGKNVEVIMLDSMPMGRKPIITRRTGNFDLALKASTIELKAGHQVYIICPLIDESLSEKMSGVMSVHEAAVYAEKFYDKTNLHVRVGMVTGDMSSDDVVEATQRFKDGDIHVLVGTSIVEVGVNNPNATVMIIASAERFGLASLHQIRGRVGRGKMQSYCFLVSDKDKDRLRVICSTTNGFDIAEADLKLRHGGQLLGMKQSGQSEEIESILKYPKLARMVRDGIEGIA